MTTPGGGTAVDLPTTVQALVDLVVIPNQTQDQVNAGLLSFPQVRERVVAVQQVLAGDPSSAVLSYEQVRDFIRDNVPSITQAQKSIAELTARIASAEQ